MPVRRHPVHDIDLLGLHIHHPLVIDPAGAGLQVHLEHASVLEAGQHLVDPIIAALDVAVEPARVGHREEGDPARFGRLGRGRLADGVDVVDQQGGGLLVVDLETRLAPGGIPDEGRVLPAVDADGRGIETLAHVARHLLLLDGGEELGDWVLAGGDEDSGRGEMRLGDLLGRQVRGRFRHRERGVAEDRAQSLVDQVEGEPRVRGKAVVGPAVAEQAGHVLEALLGGGLAERIEPGFDLVGRIGRRRRRLCAERAGQQDRGERGGQVRDELHGSLPLT